MSSGSGYSVVPVQRVFLPLRIVQMVFAVGVFGIAAYHLSLLASYDAGGLNLFTALATVIFLIYWFVANSPTNSNLYNYWAIFAVELFVLIFWLCSFALTADKVALLNAVSSYDDGSSYSGDSSSGTYCYAGYCVNTKRDIVRRAVVDPVSATLYVALALSVINFVLFATTFTLFTINLFRHRAAHSGARGNNFAMHETHGTASQMEKGGVGGQYHGAN